MNSSDVHRLGFDEDSTDPINFVETLIMSLSPFSAHEVLVDGVRYKTAEHAYHALRMLPKARAEIMSAASPIMAWQIAQLCKDKNLLLPAHDKDAVMEKIFRAKLEQHADVQDILLQTKHRDLVKIFATDYYWGTGADGTGENKMGVLWMKLRDEMQDNN